MKDGNSVGEAALKLSEINPAQLAVNLRYNVLRKLYFILIKGKIHL